MRRSINKIKGSWLQRATRLAGRFGVLLFFTLLLLEIAVRIIWGRESAITVGDKEIALLPFPLVTEIQSNTLKDWSLTSDSYLIFDPVLGWNIRPNAVGERGNIRYTSNGIGLRSLREYQLTKPEDVIRIAAFGPSFTFADEVQDKMAWPALMEQARPDLEVMNWGVGGYGTDQAFLRYQRQGAAYRPDVVLIGYEDNNRYRNVNRFRPFYKKGETNLPLVKPIYMLEQDDLILVKSPFETFDSFYDTLSNNPARFLDLVCPKDYFCDRRLYQAMALDKLAGFRFFRTLIHILELNPPLEVDRRYPEEISLRLLEMFIKEVVAHEARPIVILFPQQVKLLSDFEKGKFTYSHKYISAIQDRGGLVIDLNEAFVEAKQRQNLRYEDFFMNGDEGGHYTELGNKIVSQAILQHLCQFEIITDCTPLVHN